MKVLMCPPKYYQILWEINPWMKKENQPDKILAKNQWENLFKIYQKLKLNILLIPPQKGLADMVYIANAGWGKGKNFVVSNFKHKERKKEKSFYLKWFKSKGFKLFTLPKNISFEGGGDIVTTKEVYLFGYGKRSDFQAKDYLKKFLKLKKPIIPLKLVDERFFHLDTCFFYIKPIDTILYFPKAFDSDSQEKIKRLRARKFEASEKEAEDFLCNSVYFNKTIILGCRNERIERFLRNKGLNIIFADISEFKKGGGGVKCLSLFLD